MNLSLPTNLPCRIFRFDGIRGGLILLLSVVAASLLPPTPRAAAQTNLGTNASLLDIPFFLPNHPLNTPIDQAPIDRRSKKILRTLGKKRTLHPDFGANLDGQPFGIPYIVVSSNQPKVPVTFDFADESDPGPYPIPPNAPIEGGPDSDGDRHILIVDRDNRLLYELFAARPISNGVAWTAGSGAIFDLATNSFRPDGWTSADAAGLPILPCLIRYDEVHEQGEIRHAIRFTARRTRAAYVFPARHAASSLRKKKFPPMGARLRLRADFDITPFPPSAQVILRALKTYGLILADNGSDWFFTGTADPRWNDEELNTLKSLEGRDFEVVALGEVTELDR